MDSIQGSPSRYWSHCFASSMPSLCSVVFNPTGNIQKRFGGGTVLPRFKHTSVFRCLFMEPHHQTHPCYRVSGPFPDGLKSPELHQLLTLSLTRKSPQVNSGRMSCGCTGEGSGTVHAQDRGRNLRCESGWLHPFVLLLCSHTPGPAVGTSRSCRM